MHDLSVVSEITVKMASLFQEVCSVHLRAFHQL